jgi:2-polyprenyl-3-methyl-5-hydroxy-6-metoxy-1,4-benzoquinol methylase
MTTDLATQQTLQDDEYSFPYHYVAQFRGTFQQCYLDSWSINYVSTIEYLLEKIRSQPQSRLVDIGCGDGRFSRELALAFGDSSVVGIDYSQRAIALAAVMNAAVPNLQFKRLDITERSDLPAFDVAVLMEVFEHIPLEHAKEFMRGVHGLLKKGGTLLLTVPHQNKPLEYKHFQHFTIESLLEYLRPHFDVVEVVPFEKISISRRLVTAMLSNRLFILNSGRLLRAIYGWYKRNLFFCGSEKKCQRIFVKATAR